MGFGVWGLGFRSKEHVGVPGCGFGLSGSLGVAGLEVDAFRKVWGFRV